MLGKRSAQRRLFTADHLDLAFVGQDSIYAFFAREGRALFADEEFAHLYRDGGRPSVPPSLLAIASILQRLHKLSDQALIEATQFDLRFKVALGLGHHDVLCAKSTLQNFRAQLIVHNMDLWLHQRIVDLAKSKKVLKQSGLTVALDTSPVLGRGAVRDTINLLGDGMAKVLRALAALEDDVSLDELAARHDLSRYVDEARSLKGHAAIDWHDEAAVRGFLRSVVADADRVLTLAAERLVELAEPQAAKLRAAAALLATLLAQDIERDGGPDDDPGAAIREGTAPDRIVSVTDPQMRHGRKSATKRFEGHKASMAVDTDSGIILEIEAKPGNASDNRDTLETIERIEAQHKVAVATTLGDCAYGDGATRAAFAAAGRELIAKVPKPSAPKGRFAKQDFAIDLTAGTVTCPAGHTTSDRCRHGDGTRYSFDAATCATCPLRAQCCSGRGGRSIRVHPQEALLQEARAYQQTSEFAARYRARQRAEHRLARLMTQLDGRQARYIGLRKTTLQLRLTAAAANLVRVLNALRGLIFALYTLTQPCPPSDDRPTSDRWTTPPPRLPNHRQPLAPAASPVSNAA